MWACFHPAGSVPDTSTMTLLNLTKCTALTSQLGNWGTLKMHLNTCRENVMKTEPGFFQQCPATEQKAMGTNWKKRRFPLNIWKCCFTVRVNEHQHRLLRAAAESSSLEILVDTLSWAKAFRFAFLIEQEVWTTWPPEVLPNSTFYFSVKSLNFVFLFSVSVD